MIRIIQRQRPVGNTKLCQLCLSGPNNLYKVEGKCETCIGRIITAFSCPHCGRISHFNGVSSQTACPGCHRTVPSIMLVLKRQDTRKYFHNHV